MAGGAGDDRLIVSGPELDVDGGDGNDVFLLAAATGEFVGGAGDDLIEGSLQTGSLVIIDAGLGDDEVNVSGPMVGDPVHIAVTLGGGNNTLRASNVYGKILVDNEGVSNNLRAFGTSSVAGTVNTTLLNSRDIEIFGSVTSGSNVTVRASRDVSIYGNVGDRAELSDVIDAVIDPSLFGGSQRPGSITTVVSNSSDVRIFGSPVVSVGMSATVSNSTDVRIFGSPVPSSISVAGGRNVDIFGIAEGSILFGDAGQDGPELGTIRISDFGGMSNSPRLDLAINNSRQISIFGTLAKTAAPLSATLRNSSDVSIFGSMAKQASISVLGGRDVGIYGVVSGDIAFGPSDSSMNGDGVLRGYLEATADSSGMPEEGLMVRVANSIGIGVFGSGSPNSASLSASIRNSSEVRIFGSARTGGILDATSSYRLDVFGQSLDRVQFSDMKESNVFTEAFGAAQPLKPLEIVVGGGSSEIDVFGSVIRNAKIRVADSRSIDIYGGTAITVDGQGKNVFGDSVELSNVEGGNVLAAVFGDVAADNRFSLLDVIVDGNSRDIDVFGSIKSTSRIQIRGSREIGIYNGFGDNVTVEDSEQIRIEGGVFGSPRTGQKGLSTVVSGSSSNIAIYGSSVGDQVLIESGMNIGLDLRGGNDDVDIENANGIVALGDNGDDLISVRDSSNVLLYLADGKDKAKILSGSNIRVIGAENDDTLYIENGVDIDLDGGGGVDRIVIAGGVGLSVRSDDGDDEVKLFGGKDIQVSGGSGREKLQVFGSFGSVLQSGQVYVVLDGQAGDDRIEVKPLLSLLSIQESGSIDPVNDLPLGISLPASFMDRSISRYPSSIAMVGGTGNDEFWIEGNQRIYSLGGDGDDDFEMISGNNTTLAGGDGDDSFSLKSNGVDNYVFGDQSDDSVVLLDGTRWSIFSEEGDDSITIGGSVQSTVRSGGGQDQIQVHGGSDLLVSGEEGKDTVNVTAGTRVLVGGGSGNDEFEVVGGSSIVLLGEEGNDTLDFINGDSVILSGGDGDDTLIAKGRGVDLYGDDGDDTYRFVSDSSPRSTRVVLRELQLLGGKDFEPEARGSDTLDFSGFDQGIRLSLQTGDMEQTIFEGQLSLVLTGSFENIIGTDGDDELIGTEQSNRLDGRAGNDRLEGKSGDDVLIGGTGNDLLVGGFGDDEYAFSTSANDPLGVDVLLEDVNAGVDLLNFIGLPTGLGVLDLESHDQQVLADGILRLTLRRNGDDPGFGHFEDVVGTNSGETIFGNQLDNRFELLGGDDTVAGRSGSDIYVFKGGNLGHDVILEEESAEGRDTLDFTAFDQSLNLDLSSSLPQSFGSDLTLSLSTGSAIENAVGTSFNDVILGNQLDNALYGAAGSDHLDGKDGDDRVFGGLPVVVLLDFDSAFQAQRGDYEYSSQERDRILSRIRADYSSFDWIFTQSEESAKSLTVDSGRSYVRLAFSEGRGGGVSGDAGEVDFRNINRRVVSQVNINPLRSTITDLLGADHTEEQYSDMIVALTATIASHELAHTAGLRHADAFGPIGFGVFFATDLDEMYPPYMGSRDAYETPWHIIASPASVGTTIADASRDTFFGERESIKLSFNEIGHSRKEMGTTFETHSTFGNAEDLGNLVSLSVPNLAPISGFLRSGQVFQVEALAVIGDLRRDEVLERTEVDIYKFTGEKR